MLGKDQARRRRTLSLAFRSLTIYVFLLPCVTFSVSRSHAARTAKPGKLSRLSIDVPEILVGEHGIPQTLLKRDESQNLALQLELEQACLHRHYIEARLCVLVSKTGRRSKSSHAAATALSNQGDAPSYHTREQVSLIEQSTRLMPRALVLRNLCRLGTM